MLICKKKIFSQFCSVAKSSLRRIPLSAVVLAISSLILSKAAFIQLQP